MTLLAALVALCVVLQCGFTQTGILENLPETWYINQNSETIDGRTHQIRKDSTQCTCSCEVKVDAPTGQGHSVAGSTPDEGVQGGWLGTDDVYTVDGWSSDGQASDESPMKWKPTTDDQGGATNDLQPPFYPEENSNNKNKMADNELGKDAPDRYKGYSWGHGSRYPWKSLKDTMCIRQPCSLDSDCCFRWNICDKSAKVCTNCWYGHPCLSERDCCFDFPFCHRKWKTDENGQRTSVESGRCADQR